MQQVNMNWVRSGGVYPRVTTFYASKRGVSKNPDDVRTHRSYRFPLCWLNSGWWCHSWELLDDTHSKESHCWNVSISSWLILGRSCIMIGWQETAEAGVDGEKMNEGPDRNSTVVYASGVQAVMEVGVVGHVWRWCVLDLGPRVSSMKAPTSAL